MVLFFERFENELLPFRVGFAVTTPSYGLGTVKIAADNQPQN